MLIATMTAADFNRLLELFRSDPSVRDELRRVILTDDLLGLPPRMDRVEDALDRLAAAQERTEQRLDALAAAQGRTEESLRALATAQERTEQRLQDLASIISRIDHRTGRLERLAGGAFEVNLGDRVAAVLASVGLEVRPVSRAEVARYFQRLGAAGSDLRRLRSQPDWHGLAQGRRGSALVVAEASVTADDHDAHRLVEWQEIARRYGTPTIPVLIARRRSGEFPQAEELEAHGITWEISEMDEGAVVVEPAMGAVEL
ncbi:MAG: hypothetical protein ABR564_07725 [Candidatus Dormibacteria bacterium]